MMIILSTEATEGHTSFTLFYSPISQITDSGLRLDSGTFTFPAGETPPTLIRGGTYNMVASKSTNITLCRYKGITTSGEDDMWSETLAAHWGTTGLY